MVTVKVVLRGGDTSLAIWIICLQAAVSALMACILLILFDSAAALTALVGGAVMAAATMVVAAIAFKQRYGASVEQELRCLLIGALFKYGVIVICLALLFRYCVVVRQERNALIFFCTLMVVQGAYWAAPLLRNPSLFSQNRIFDQSGRKS